MIDMVKRHEIQVLRRAGHEQAEVAELSGVSVRSVRRVEGEPPVTSFDTESERERRRVGRPSMVEPFRPFLLAELAKEPELMSLELLRRVQAQGYAGGKSALYALLKELRPHKPRPVVRFEGLPGEFSQHDFGQVDVRFLEGSERRVHFFASRLKYSRWVQVSIVPDERVESLVRTLVEHFAAWAGCRCSPSSTGPRPSPFAGAPTAKWSSGTRPSPASCSTSDWASSCAGPTAPSRRARSRISSAG